MHTPPTNPVSVAAEPVEADEIHLKVLMILSFVFAGLLTLGVCGGGLYIFMGQFVANNPNMAQPNNPNDPSPEFMAQLFTWMGIGISAVSVIFATLVLISAFSIRARTRRLYSMIIAGVCCLNVPLGTALGVYSFIVLTRPGVRRLYSLGRAN